jgi:hypothetical protein
MGPTFFSWLPSLGPGSIWASAFAAGICGWATPAACFWEHFYGKSPSGGCCDRYGGFFGGFWPSRLEEYLLFFGKFAKKYLHS